MRENGQTVPVACERCGATVWVTAGEAAGTAPVYCSTSCEDGDTLA